MRITSRLNSCKAADPKQYKRSFNDRGDSDRPPETAIILVRHSPRFSYEPSVCNGSKADTSGYGRFQSLSRITIFPCDPFAAGLTLIVNGLPSFDLPVTASPASATSAPCFLNWSRK